jgi:hypothetical protein
MNTMSPYNFHAWQNFIILFGIAVMLWDSIFKVPSSSLGQFTGYPD